MKPKDLMGAMLMDLNARHAKAAREGYDVDGLGYPVKPAAELFCDMCPGTQAHNLSCPRAGYGQVVAPVDVADAPLRAVADVTDDEIVDAFVAVYGMRGFDSHEEPIEPLATALGVSLDGDAFEETYDALCARLNAIEAHGRLCEDPRDEMTVIVSAAEWGRRIAEALCVGETQKARVAATVTRILSGECEEARNGEG